MSWAGFRRSGFRRFMGVFLGVFLTLMGGSIVFGFSSLQPMLEDQGVFRSKCNITAMGTNKTCHAQDLELNLMYTIGSSACNMWTVFAGLLSDYLSPRHTAAGGCVLLVLGSLLSVYCGDTGVFAGFIILGIAGPMVFIPSLLVEQFYPRFSVFITSAVVCALNASPFTYLVFDWLYKADFSLKTIYLSYAVFSGISAVLCVLFFHTVEEIRSGGPPEDSTQHRHYEVVINNERTALIPAEDTHSDAPHPYHTGMSRPLSKPAPHTVQFHHHPAPGKWWPDWMRGAHFYAFAGACAFLSILSLSTNLYIGSLEDQLKWKAGPDRPYVKYQNGFNWILPLSCMMTTLFMGPIAKLCERYCLDWLHFLIGALIVAVDLVLENFTPLPQQWIAFFMYGFAFTAPYVIVAEFIRLWFPVEFRGSLYGTVIFIVSFFGFLNTPLTSLALNHERGSFLDTNNILIGITCASALQSIYLFFARKTLQKEQKCLNPGWLPQIDLA
jgi:MFS family permease